ncbi:LexA family transcriptional regulator [Streptococcus thermophilus]|uniref:Pleiotropic regulator of exopolysaccharide synthesis, competence and biofilm formation Ftr, XRE family n=1 Tax=Streptococcus gallolyticus TaxID=315405 RepID=A0A380K403_9STRE|nr:MULTISPECIES: LexA family transcriptional regulator [Streptococcus]MCO4565961.1 Pleiotropic regulator of exopolysaccharide synthesis, competence and biofilm formation [Streptococcus infantarius subsp. infantarius]MSU87659.1 helix-turn-helix domain-containing protein [Streptococcus dysgalactiae subsp. dysgalactiae]SUN59303.1 Pleiotropic regulator of exopolysaccharide synthesis, competence and biofilm formation Ftr, XRE family [Streptococcus gallolyticus]KEH52969.1 DNA-binding protein [Strepto
MYQPDKLKQKREELGLEQQELAELIGVSKQAYFKWEKGLSKPTKANIAKLEKVLKVPEGYLSEDEISSLYKQLTEPNQEKAITYVRDLVSSQKVISIAEKRSEYRVYEKLSAGIGASVYGDLDYDVVYYNEELPHDFASWVDGNSMEPTYQNGEVALIRETGFDYDGAVYAVVWDSQTYIKKVYREEEGLRLVSINKDYPDKFAPFDENPRVIGKIVGHFMPLED